MCCRPSLSPSGHVRVKLGIHEETKAKVALKVLDKSKLAASAVKQVGISSTRARGQ